MERMFFYDLLRGEMLQWTEPTDGPRSHVCVFLLYVHTPYFGSDLPCSPVIPYVNDRRGRYVLRWTRERGLPPPES